MCMRNKVLTIGEKIFNVLIIVAILAGAASAVFANLPITTVGGMVAMLLQIILSWSGTLIVALIVYALLDIRHMLANK